MLWTAPAPGGKWLRFDGYALQVWVVVGCRLETLDAWTDAVHERRLEQEDHWCLIAHFGHEVPQKLLALIPIQRLCLLAVQRVHLLVREDLERAAGDEVLDGKISIHRRVVIPPHVREWCAVEIG